MYIEGDELNILINYESSDVHEPFSKCTDFEEAINILKRAFIQEKSDIFARHVFATENQQARETLDQYLQALYIVVKG